jgi:hypothetical protein
MSLPLRLEPTDIIPMGKPGKAEPDFFFYPKGTTPIPFYGVVELKRPDSQIVTITRSNIALLTRDAQTAIEQAGLYANLAKKFLPIQRTDEIIFLGNKTYLFVIMGMSHELNNKLGIEFYHEIVSKNLPGNLQLIPYDILLRFFEDNIPKRIILLVHSMDNVLVNIIDETSLLEWLNRSDIVASLLKDLRKALIGNSQAGLRENDLGRLMVVCSKAQIHTIADLEKALQPVLQLSEEFFYEIRFEADMRIDMSAFDAVFFLLIFSNIAKLSFHDLSELISEDAANVILSASKTVLKK